MPLQRDCYKTTFSAEGQRSPRHADGDLLAKSLVAPLKGTPVDEKG